MEKHTDKSPFFKTWNRWYAFVLIVLVILIISFYFFTKRFA
ncbi:MAG: hypothetical protein ACM3H8_08480 [Sphingobacteriales bacterium]